MRSEGIYKRQYNFFTKYFQPSQYLPLYKFIIHRNLREIFNRLRRKGFYEHDNNVSSSCFGETNKPEVMVLDETQIQIKLYKLIFAISGNENVVIRLLKSVRFCPDSATIFVLGPPSDMVN